MEDSWKRLKADCEGCEACRLCETRHSVVVGVGAENARVLLVGEGPGEQEDLQGEPFVGPAGKLLDVMLELIGLDRSRIYIANCVKCRPPHNRDPEKDELQACAGFLRRQIALLDPKLVVCLGRIAAQSLIREGLSVTREHGVWQEIDGRLFMATYHPSALLRDLSKRPEAFEDFVSLRQRIREKCPETYKA
ncbi:MAG: uracil-DNA glycosylase [Oscillospiraceae bacterium]|nr:uracil-DNA glycosylase [Oscillospiraceae bacterium]